MAKQTQDTNKVIGRLLRDQKKLKEIVVAFDTLGIYAYTEDMKDYTIRQLVKRYNRRVMYMHIINKVRALFNIKPIDNKGPIIVNNPNR